MIIKKVFLSFLICAFCALFSLNTVAATEENPLAKFSKILPEKVGEFRKVRGDEIKQGKDKTGKEQVLVFSRYYELKNGFSISVEIQRANSEDDAYSLFTLNPLIRSTVNKQKCEVGLVCYRWESAGDKGINFIKGTGVVTITATSRVSPSNADEKQVNNEPLLSSLATLVADNIERGEGEIPSLIQHLPNWENVQTNTVYVRNLDALKSALANLYLPLPLVFEAVTFVEGTEAVVAKYDTATKLVIIEYPTPQLATDADQKITQKISELKSNDLLIKTTYKRVGNYSVFVFDAPDEAAANNLINKIEYGKTVQWLYGDPFENERANRKYLTTTGGIIITVLKTAGLALMLCLIIGGGFGYFVFMRRRKQAAMTTAYSDAGGMLRLNLDEMTPQRDPTRLLEKANK